MRWKKNANIIIVCILSLAYTIVTLLNIIGPLHMNAAGSMNQLGMLSIYSLVYCGLALLLTWTIYFKFNDKPELLFFLLMILGIAIIILEVFIWGLMGS